VAGGGDQLQQGQRIAPGLGEHVRPQVGRYRVRSLGQQPVRGVIVQAGEAQFRQAGGEELGRVLVPRGEDHGDRLRVQPTGGEQQRMRRTVVQPVRVVDQAQQRPVLGQLRQQGQHRQSDQEPVAALAGVQPERRPQRPFLPSRQGVDAVEARPEQQVQARER
jgi:hypothetical protein